MMQIGPWTTGITGSIPGYAYDFSRVCLEYRGATAGFPEHLDRKLCRVTKLNKGMNRDLTDLLCGILRQLFGANRYFWYGKRRIFSALPVPCSRTLNRCSK